MVKVGPYTFTEEEVHQWFTLGEESQRWMTEHRDELKQRYPDEWVACFKDQVIDHDKSLKRLCRRIWKRFPEGPHGVAMDLIISGEEPVMIV